MSNFKFYAVAAILAFACFVAISSYLPERFDTTQYVKMADFPQKVGAWTSEDIKLTQRDYDILETTNLIMRNYKDPAGQSVLLYIVYSDNNRKVAHPPEVCYTGSGSTITEKKVFNVTPTIQANQMVVETTKGDRQYVVYWFRAGQLNIAKYLDQQLAVVWRRTFGKRTSSAMIRISADAKEGQDAATGKMISEFASAIEPLLAKYVP
jgi:EpsI family protein